MLDIVFFWVLFEVWNKYKKTTKLLSNSRLSQILYKREFWREILTFSLYRTTNSLVFSELNSIKIYFGNLWTAVQYFSVKIQISYVLLVTPSQEITIMFRLKNLQIFLFHLPYICFESYCQVPFGEGKYSLEKENDADSTYIWSSKCVCLLRYTITSSKLKTNEFETRATLPHCI